MLLNIVERRVLSFREGLLYVVSKSEIIRLIFAGSFLISYLYLLKMFFLLPYIVADYNLIVNTDIKIYLAIIILVIYSLTTEKLYESRLKMLIDIIAAEFLTILGMYFPI